MMFRLKAESTGSTVASYTCMSQVKTFSLLCEFQCSRSFKNFPSLTLFELIAAANFISWLWPESFKPLV